MKIKSYHMSHSVQSSQRLLKNTKSQSNIAENHLKPLLLPHQLLHYLRAPQFLPIQEFPNIQLSKPVYEELIAKRNSVREFTPLTHDNSHSSIMKYLSLLTKDPVIKRSMSVKPDLSNEGIITIKKPHIPQLVARPYSSYKPQIARKQIIKKSIEKKIQKNAKKEVNLQMNAKPELKLRVRHREGNILRMAKNNQDFVKNNQKKGLNLRIIKRSSSQPGISSRVLEKVKLYL